MIRLRLAWGLGKKRRLSKKEQYRKKVEKSSITYFKRLKKKKKVKCHFWYTGFPHILVTRKAQGGRMGKGKGNIKIWYYPNYEGRFLLVVRGYDYYTLRKLLKSILKRLPIKGKVVFNQVNINTQIYETLFPSSTWWR